MENYYINSNYDNVRLNINKYNCDDPKAIVLIVHGMCEYKERYNKLCELLNNNSYKVFSYDHRGHGKSVIDNKYGYFSKKNGYKAIVDDLKTVITHIKTDNPGIKLYVFSHSMGTIVTRLYLKEYSKAIDKLILCGAPNYQKMAKLGVFIAGMIKLFQGDDKSSKLLTNLSVGQFNKKIPNPKSNNSWISYNEENVIKYDNDPLCSFTFTNSAYKDLFKMLSLIGKKNDYLYVNESLPIKLIVGKDDPCIGGNKGLRKSISLLKDAGFKNISKKVFSNMRHEILNENNNEEVYQEILNFYDEVL